MVYMGVMTDLTKVDDFHPSFSVDKSDRWSPSDSNL